MLFDSKKILDYILLAALAVAVAILLFHAGSLELFSALSAAYAWFHRGVTTIAFDLEKYLLPPLERFPLKPLPGAPLMQQQIIAFLAQALLNALHKAVPNLPADAATQITNIVTAAVALAWDIAKVEASTELAKLNAADLTKLFPQLANFIPAQSV